jgi:hypothetical protein
VALRDETARYLLSRYRGCRIAPIATDASTREFFRLSLDGGETRVVMDYGGPFREEPSDVRLARVFRQAPLPVAEVLDVVPDPGLLVLQDLGRFTLEQVLLDTTGRATQALSLSETGELLRERLYREATRLAAAIAVSGTRALAASELATGPALDAERFRFEMDFFVEHFVRRYCGIDSVPPELGSRLQELAELAAETPARVLCHRDYHSRNLIVRPDGSLAMVDIQDARWGPDTYDLASLLRDAYLDLDEELVERMIRLYSRHLPVLPDPLAFRRRFDRVAAQRMIKALGTFGYQICVRGRERYRDAIPRTLERLGRLLPRLEETADVHRALTDASVL